MSVQFCNNFSCFNYRCAKVIKSSGACHKQRHGGLISNTQTKQINLRGIWLNAICCYFQIRQFTVQSDLDTSLVLFFYFVFISLQRHGLLRGPGDREQEGGGRARDWQVRIGRPPTPVAVAGSGSGGGEGGGGPSAALTVSSATLQTASAALISPTGAIRTERSRMSATGSKEGGDR